MQMSLSSRWVQLIVACAIGTAIVGVLHMFGVENYTWVTFVVIIPWLLMNHGDSNRCP